jgi:nitrate reductase NapD
LRVIFPAPITTKIFIFSVKNNTDLEIDIGQNMFSLGKYDALTYTDSRGGCRLNYDGGKRERTHMNMSGILVVAKPEQCEEVAAALAKLPGIEVFQKDVESGKIVIVQEATSIEQEADGARVIQQIPGVITVNMVYHYFADDPSLKYPSSETAELSSY